MGSCISRPKKRFKKDCNQVHDKLVISQDPIISSIPNMKTIPSQKILSPAPSSSSTSSLSSFSCSTAINSSSSSSSSSSVLSAKDRSCSFSNEFLISCVKDNPHVIGLSPIANEKDRANTMNFESLAPVVQKSKQSVQERPMMVKKRARSSSPSLVRQKSYRKEQSSPNRGLRSPSPSRRHSTESNRSFLINGTNENFCRPPIIPKASAINSASSGLKRESMRGPLASPNHDLMINSNFTMRRKDKITQQIGSMIDGDVKCSQEMDAVMEDINNPLIALDCFIFL